MNTTCYESLVPAADARALADFESQFSYPLGDQCRFRICHGDDYLRFFRAMGEPALLVAGNEGAIRGSIVKVLRTFTSSLGGVSLTGKAHYLCDLKLLPSARGSMVLARLLGESKRLIEVSETRLCYSVVMGGTDRLPTDYTGRLGVPVFNKLADIAILRISSGGAEHHEHCLQVSEDDFRKISAGIPQRGIRMERGNGKLRSLMEPVHLVTPAGDACCVLEDTRSSKRLLLDSGDELVSNHVSELKYGTPEAAAMLLSDAMCRTLLNDVPAIFVAVPAREAPSLVSLLGKCLDVTQAPASIYGHGFESSMDWWIDTAEI